MRFPFLPPLALFLLLLPALGCGDDTPVLSDSGRDTGTRDSGRDTGSRDTGMSDACFPGAMCDPMVECQEGRTTCDPVGCEVSVPAAADTVCTGGTCDGSGTCVRTETAMWGASDASMFDAFGGDVAIDGSYAVIGVGSAAAGVYADAAYVFERDAGGNWRQVAGILTPSGSATGGSFGTTVDIEGETIVIGTHGASHSGAMNAGAVYVFERAMDGTWAETQELLASDPTAGQRFGRSVAIGDGHIAVGAYGVDGVVTGDGDGGLVYVFEDDGTGSGDFTEVARLLVADKRPDDGLGFSVDIDATELIAGAPFDNNEKGSVYVFERSDMGVWSEERRLEASDGALEDRFGTEVSLDGDTMAISAPFAEEGAVMNAGAVYIFERQTDMTVTQSQRLVASDPSGEALFGAVDLVGDMLLVGAPKYDRVGRSEMGIAYRFQRAGGSFTEAEKLYRLEPEVGDRFGAAVAASGSVALIGGPGVDRMAAEDVGAVFIFDPIMP